jgi:trehalose synthase
VWDEADEDQEGDLQNTFTLTGLDDYEPLVGAETLDRIREKAKPLGDIHVANVNSTYYGGGVAELLSSLSLLMNSAGVRTGWRVIQGSPDFFSITKKMHNALSGGDINLSNRKKRIYEEVVFENAVRNHLDHDIVIVHDPQPLPLIEHYTKRGPWIWRCHIDLTEPNSELWNYLSPFVERYDAVVLSLEDYRRDLETPQVFIMPALDPFSIKNRELSEAEMDDRFEHYDIPTDLPIVSQISRFDRWKDPQGAIRAFKKVREEIDCTFVLLGNVALDDPEGSEVYESLLDERDERMIILSKQDSALVNALQRRAAVILQKSRREGFGLTVTEAMWKGTPVVGTRCGGIRHQIEDGESGFLVNSVNEAAERILTLLKDEKLAHEMGRRAKERVRKRFLLTRLLEDYLNLIGSFRTDYIYTGGAKQR